MLTSGATLDGGATIFGIVWAVVCVWCAHVTRVPFGCKFRFNLFFFSFFFFLHGLRLPVGDGEVSDEKKK